MILKFYIIFFTCFYYFSRNLKNSCNVVKYNNTFFVVTYKKKIKSTLYVQIKG